MSYEEEFDKIIKQKVSEADYPFDETSWTRTSRLLDAERSAARKLLWKKMFFPGTLLVAGAVFFTVAMNDTPAVDTASSGETKNVASFDRAELLAAHRSTASEEDAPEAKGLAATSPVRKLVSTPPGPENSEPSDFSAGSSSIAESHLEMAGNSLTEENQSAADAGEITEDRTIKEEPLFHNEKSSDPLAGAGATLPDRAVVVNQETSGDEQGTKSENSGELNAALSDQSGLTETAGIFMLESRSVLLPMDEEASLLPSLVLLKRYDDDYFTGKAKSHYLNVDFGAAYLLGWNTASGKDANGFNGFAGVNYGFYFSKFSVSLGVQAYNISNIRSPFYHDERKEYGFGSNSAFTTVTTNNLYYAAIPLRLTFHQGRSVSFGLGANAGYLFRTENSVESYRTIDGSRIAGVEEKNTLLYEGVNRYNLMGSAFLNMRVNNRVGLSMEFNYSFTDIFTNMSNVNNSERPMGFRVGMQYYLFDK